MRALGLALLCVLTCSVFAACDRGTTITTTQPATGKHYTIAVIPKGTTHEFWKAVHAGAVRASRELNCPIIWNGPLKEDDRESQIATVE